MAERPSLRVIAVVKGKADLLGAPAAAGTRHRARPGLIARAIPTVCSSPAPALGAPPPRSWPAGTLVGCVGSLLLGYSRDSSLAGGALILLRPSCPSAGHSADRGCRSSKKPGARPQRAASPHRRGPPRPTSTAPRSTTRDRNRATLIWSRQPPPAKGSRRFCHLVPGGRRITDHIGIVLLRSS